MRILIGLVLLLSFHAYSCEQHGDHAHHHHHEAKLPTGLKVQIPTVVERSQDTVPVSFSFSVQSQLELADLHIEIKPNPKVNIIGDGARWDETSEQYQVTAQLASAQRGALRVLISGKVNGEPFLLSRFVMIA